MKKNLFIWQFAGITFTAVLGTLLHFFYEWTGAKVFAPISAVNESTFEHMKLVFVPAFIFSVFQSFFAKDEYGCFWVVKLIGITIGTMLIPILFYTLTGIFGELSGIVNIAIFFVSVIIGYLVELFLFNRLMCKGYYSYIALAVLILLMIFIFAFTFYPPKIPLFLDPVTNGYGITK